MIWPLIGKSGAYDFCDGRLQIDRPSLVAVTSRRFSLLVSGAFGVSTDDSDPPDDRLLRLLRDNQIDLSVAEGLRLVIAFNRIKDSSDRRVLMELAERLAR
jgi:hypothetical protein